MSVSRTPTTRATKDAALFGHQREEVREVPAREAVAVVGVLLFHLGFPAFSGGYVGVDVFFVISGFLISSVIASAA